MLWLLAAAALPVAPVDYAPELAFEPAQTLEVHLRFRRPLRAAPEGFEVKFRVLEDAPGFRRLPAHELTREGLVYYLQAPGAPSKIRPGTQRFRMQVDLSYGGRVRRRLKILHRLRLKDGPGPDLGPLLKGSLLPEDIAAAIRERALRHFVLTSTTALVPDALAALPKEAPPQLASLPPRQQLAALVRALAAGEFGVAEAHADALRGSSELAPGELARALELEAGLALLHARDTLARRRLEQALTLFPDLDTQHPLPFVQTRFDQMRATVQPSRPLAIGAIDLVRAEGAVRAEVAFGPDPARLVDTVSIRFEDLQVERSARAAHEGEGGRGRLRVDLDEELKRALVRVRLLDARGNILAEQGTDRPLSVPITRPERKKLRAPSWVWWTLGAAAVAGAGTAIGFALADGQTPQPDRNVGPFEFRF